MDKSEITLKFRNINYLAGKYLSQIYGISLELEPDSIIYSRTFKLKAQRSNLHRRIEIHFSPTSIHLGFGWRTCFFIFAKFQTARQRNCNQQQY